MVDVKAKKDEDRPSSARRIRLRAADGGSVPQVSNFFPLERYFEASEKVFSTFEMAYEKKILDNAYTYGMRYSTFCVEGIMKHDYFKSTKFHKQRAKISTQVHQVLTKLEKIAELMDIEEIEKEEKRQAILKRQQDERRRKQHQKLEDFQQKLNKLKEEQARAQSKNEGGSVQESALAKLQRLNGPVDPPFQKPASKKRVSFQPEDQLDPDGHIANSSPSVLPPPLLPPDENAPPSYQDIINYFGPTTIKPQQEPVVPSYEHVVEKPKMPLRKLSIRQYMANAQRARIKLQQERKINIAPLKTHQGRVRGSTNGCTVISACVASKHLQTHGGVTDAQIVNTIDKECVPLLRIIRGKLGLHGDSLIIPSDVHDHMVDHNLLFQHKFIGACGGNIVDHEHLGELFSLLEGEVGKTQHLKAAATLFFREHVISIVKFPTSPTEAIYDMVDSMPTCNGRASRTRCMSMNALKVQMEWYSSHKFTDSNCTYIERNEWNDVMADFDPRVFQAFVWADLPKPKG